MVVHQKEGKLYINNNWYDHTDIQLDALLEAFGKRNVKNRKHNIACNCVDCQTKQGGLKC